MIISQTDWSDMPTSINQMCFPGCFRKGNRGGTGNDFDGDHYNHPTLYNVDHGDDDHHCSPPDRNACNDYHHH